MNIKIVFYTFGILNNAAVRVMNNCGDCILEKGDILEANI
jgi:hypothetical protein